MRALQWPGVVGPRQLVRAAGIAALALSIAPAAAGRPPGPASGRLRGTVRYGSFASRALGGLDRYSVYLPPGYAASAERYPVVYFLHGLPAPATAYRSIGTIARAVEESGRRAIVVGVEGARDGDRDPEWRDWGPGRNWETATAVELVNVVDRRYRTIATRAGRVLIGISAGGYGATLIASHHPATFSVIESWSGYFRPTNPAGTSVLDLGSAAADQWADFSQQIPLLRRRFGPRLDSTYYGFYVGTNDRRFLQANRTIDAELRRYGIPHVYFRVYDGAHSWSLWREHAEAWVGRALRLAAPPS